MERVTRTDFRLRVPAWLRCLFREDTRWHGRGDPPGEHVFRTLDVRQRHIEEGREHAVPHPRCARLLDDAEAIIKCLVDQIKSGERAGIRHLSAAARRKYDAVEDCRCRVRVRDAEPLRQVLAALAKAADARAERNPVLRDDSGSVLSFVIAEVRASDAKILQRRLGDLAAYFREQSERALIPLYKW